jgi:ABC-type bacteriocin/lantibiotic exporter with double-glycine peptidase domain
VPNIFHHSRASDDARIASYLFGALGRRNALILFAIVGAMSVIDLVGIAVIFPFLQVVTEPATIEKMVWLANLVSFESLTHEKLIAVFGVGLIVFYLFKTLVQAMLLKIQTRQLARFTELMTNDTIKDVLNARYAVFQETPSSQIAGTAYGNTVHAMLALTALIQVVNEGLILVLMLVGFWIYQPMIAFGAVLLAALTALFLYQVVILRSAKIGMAQSQIENVRYRLLFSIASAIRDIKIMGLGQLFDLRNRRVSHEYAELAWRNNYNSALPRLIIEFLALFTIVGLALMVVLSDISLKEAGPLLGLMAVATIRAVPAFSKLFAGISLFRSSSPFVRGLMDMREKLARAAVSRVDDNLSFNQQIELKNIGFKYGERSILNNVSLQLKRGESIGIVGSSGAGKTTLLDLFTGLQPATEGQFLCDSVPFDPFASHAIQKLIGYVPQTITLLDETIAFNVSFEDEPNSERVMKALEMANLRNLIESLPDGVQTRVGDNGLRLSGGQRQRIGIARALYRSPQILVFDEATSSLDTLSERELTAEIEKLHGQISSVIVAHRLSTVMNCDCIYVLSNGLVESSGTHAELLLTSKIYGRLYNSQHVGSCE